jgi:hypothetical protein
MQQELRCNEDSDNRYWTGDGKRAPDRPLCHEFART